MAGEKADVLMIEQMPEMIVDGIAEAFTLYKLWEAPDREKLIRELGPRLRAMAAGGPLHDRVDGASDDGSVCVALPSSSSRYFVVSIMNGVAKGALDVHLYDLAPDGGYQIAGIERKDPGGP